MAILIWVLLDGFGRLGTHFENSTVYTSRSHRRTSRRRPRQWHGFGPAGRSAVVQRPAPQPHRFCSRLPNQTRKGDTVGRDQVTAVRLYTTYNQMVRLAIATFQDCAVADYVLRTGQDLRGHRGNNVRISSGHLPTVLPLTAVCRPGCCPEPDF